MPRRHSNVMGTACGLGTLTLAVMALGTVDLSAQAPPAEAQIAEAVMAAPAAQRAGAKVIGWRDDGTTTTLREGTNGLVCLADNPVQEAWSVACYPVSIDPYMARGREIREKGLAEGQEVTQMRWDEADAGTLAMPEEPATVYILHGEGFDVAAGEVIAPFLRWAIYTPWATLESTGLPPQPTGPGAPWLMFPGTPGSHIMVTPAPPGGGN
jgi:hypothetical protein